MLKRVRVRNWPSRISRSKSPTRRWTCWRKRGYDPHFGARPLRRIIQNLIEDPLAEGMLDARFVPGKRIRVDVEDDLLRLSQEDREAVEEGELAIASAES